MSSMVEQLVEVLLKNKMTICTAESCTGGLIASMIVDIPGASDVFDRGFITYANEAKHDLLGVTWEALDTYGAVSPQVAEQMAHGAAKAGAGCETAGTLKTAEAVCEGDAAATPSMAAAKAVVGLSVTGIAGPGGGTAAKPVGLVYIGCHVDGCGGKTFVEECHFDGDRRSVRESAAKEALRFALECLSHCGIA